MELDSRVPRTTTTRSTSVRDVSATSTTEKCRHTEIGLHQSRLREHRPDALDVEEPAEGSEYPPDGDADADDDEQRDDPRDQWE